MPRLVGTVAAVVATLLLGAPTMSAAPVDAASTRPHERSTTDAGRRAQAALERVRRVLAPPEDSTSPGGAEAIGPRTPVRLDLTLALRDLARLRVALPPLQRAEADRLLARPTDGPRDPNQDGYDTAEATPVCSAVVCVHYVDRAGDRDAVSRRDADHDGVPDYVESALATFTHVDRTYRAAGYHPPESDGVRGGNALPDVYLADVGRHGLYGYCTSDQAGSPATTWAYCVVDNDYARGQFPSRTPLTNLQVTAAHEYFHAVQFGYDYGADAWFMEATATWVEDEVYDEVNDNRQFLHLSPLTRPQASMDQFDPETGMHYGDWIFFRYLSEHLPAAAAGLPTVVRDIWRRDDRRAGTGQYSMQAVAGVLRRRGLDVHDVFAGFAAANTVPGRAYSEGTAYPTAPLVHDTLVRPSSTRLSGVRVIRDHLSSATLRYRPARGLTGRRTLHLSLDLPARFKDPVALLTVLTHHGLRRISVPLDRNGDKDLTTDFTRADVTWVEVTLTNASTRYRCGHDTRFSCAGVPKDDHLTFRLTGRVTTR